MALFKASEALEKSKMNLVRKERERMTESQSFIDNEVSTAIRKAVSEGKISCVIETFKQLDFRLVGHSLRGLGYSVNITTERSVDTTGSYYTPRFNSNSKIAISWS